jgi:hypothetical protein
MIIDDEYQGPRWRYGLRNRPVMIGTVPRGRIVQSERPHPNFLYGTVDFPFELSAEDVYGYELELVETETAG